MTARTVRAAAADSAETVLRRSPEPIFDELVRQWSDTGRIVPGRADQEWTALVAAAPWPRTASARTVRRRLVVASRTVRG